MHPFRQQPNRHRLSHSTWQGRFSAILFSGDFMRRVTLLLSTTLLTWTTLPLPAREHPGGVRQALDSVGLRP